MDFVASLMAKKTAPPGILLRSGAEIPPKLPEKSSTGLEMEYKVLVIWRRTVAVSRGYLTRVLVVDKAAPETKPDTVSENVSLFKVSTNRFILDDRAVVVVFAEVGSTTKTLTLTEYTFMSDKWSLKAANSLQNLHREKIILSIFKQFFYEVI